MWHNNLAFYRNVGGGPKISVFMPILSGYHKFLKGKKSKKYFTKYRIKHS